jgi:hypothetical protein
MIVDQEQDQLQDIEYHVQLNSNSNSNQVIESSDQNIAVQLGSILQIQSRIASTSVISTETIDEQNAKDIALKLYVQIKQFVSNIVTYMINLKLYF